MVSSLTSPDFNWGQNLYVLFGGLAPRDRGLGKRRRCADRRVCFCVVHAPYCRSLAAPLPFKTRHCACRTRQEEEWLPFSQEAAGDHWYAGSLMHQLRVNCGGINDSFGEITDGPHFRVPKDEVALLSFPCGMPELSVDPGNPGDESVGFDRAENGARPPCWRMGAAFDPRRTN
jgi:hypothetical protein